MKIVRVLIYEGDEEFIHKCLKSRAVVVEKVFKNNSIKEFFLSQFPTFSPLIEFDALLPDYQAAIQEDE